MTTDTPRTDAVVNEPCGQKWEKLIENSRQLERELAVSLENQVKAQAEVERLKEQYESAAESVARMHEAAVGEIRGPIISVIEDIKAVRERAEKAEAEVERLQRLRPTRDDVKELERELTKVTKERNDSTQAYIILDASYKMLRDSNRQLQKAIESI